MFDRFDKRIYEVITSDRPEWPEYKNRDKNIRNDIKKSALYERTRGGIALCDLGKCMPSFAQACKNIHRFYRKISIAKK